MASWKQKLTKLHNSIIRKFWLSKSMGIKSIRKLVKRLSLLAGFKGTVAIVQCTKGLVIK